MSRIDIRITCDTDEVDRDLNRIVRGPGRAAHLRFDQILSQQFGKTQLAVHVITGSLKLSGSQESRGRREGGWRGEIVYGGDFSPPSSLQPGPPRNPGLYAGYEFDRGATHNWQRAARLVDDEGDYAKAVTDWMRDDI
jgi:hypothetical protein